MFAKFLIAVILVIIGIGALYYLTRIVPSSIYSGKFNLSCSPELNIRRIFNNDEYFKVVSGPTSTPSGQVMWKGAKNEGYFPTQTLNQNSWNIEFNNTNLAHLKQTIVTTVSSKLINEGYQLNALNTVSTTSKWNENLVYFFNRRKDVYVFIIYDRSDPRIEEFKGNLSCFTLTGQKTSPIFDEVFPAILSSRHGDVAAGWQYEILRYQPNGKYLELSARPYPGGAGLIVALEKTTGSWKYMWAGQDHPPCETFENVRDEVIGRECFDKNLGSYSVVK